MTATKFNDIDTLLPRLAEIREHTVDLLIPVKDVAAVTRDEIVMTEDGIDETKELVLTIPDGLTFGMTRPALTQLCTRISERGTQDLKAAYVDTLCQRDPRAIELARENVGYWLDQVRDDTHRGGQSKHWFVRFQSKSPIDLDEDDLPVNADLMARAILSDKYFAVDNLDLIASVVEVIRNFTDDTNAAAGVQFVDWRLTQTKMDLLLVNPRVVFDLKNPDAGVQVNEFKTQMDASGHFLQPETTDRGQHLVYPCARITNSETGQGGLEVVSGFLEKACWNKAMVGLNVAKRHLGALMDGTSKSVETRDARRHAILCEIKDAVQIVFDPSDFESTCQKFLGLFNEEVSEVKPVIENVVKSEKLPQVLIDEILTAYSPMTPGKDTLGDVQRAVTNVATKAECNEDTARALEDAGGALVNATPAKKRRLLAV